MTQPAQRAFQRELARFVHSLAPRYPKAVRSTTRLFEAGVVDSLQVLHLIAYLERTLAIQIPDERVTLKNFRSIQAITYAFWKP